MPLALHLWTVESLLVGVSTAISDDRRRELHALLGGSPSLDPVIDLLTADGLANTAPFVLAASENDGVRLVIRGDLKVTVTRTDGSSVDEGPGRSATWRDDVVADVADLAVPTGPDGGVVTWLVPSPPEPEPEPAPVAVAEPAEPEPQAEAEPVAEPAPEVEPEAATPVVDERSDRPDPEPHADTAPAAPSTAPDYSGLLGRTVYDRIGTSSATAAPSTDSDPEGPSGSAGLANRTIYDRVGGGPTLSEPTTASPDARTGVLTGEVGSEEATQPWAPPTPGPGEVQAVLCPHGHANAPTAVVCRACGVPIVDSTVSIVTRPILARLVFEDGPVIDVDRTQIIGRGPTSPTGLVEAPNLIAVPNPDGDLSREHTAVRIEGWDLVIEDLGSTNGTEVHLPGREPQRLHDHDPILVVPGTKVTLAGVVRFTIERPTDPAPGSA